MSKDDAQSIYKSRSGPDFSLSSVGIQAKGRTTILRLNYRNTREILEFAYAFISYYLSPHNADNDHIPVLKPESAGVNGVMPVVRQFDTLADEVKYSVDCLRKWHTDGVPWYDMAVLYTAKYQGDMLTERLQKYDVPHALFNTREAKLTYDPLVDQVTVLTIHSSKGLEFPRVIITGISQMKAEKNRQEKNARLLYVGMTRAQKCLLMTVSSKSEYSDRLLEIGSSKSLLKHPNIA